MTYDRMRPNTASDRSPLRGLLDFESINDSAQSAGTDIRGAIVGAVDGVVDFIRETTGIDLSELAAALEGIDLSNPGSILVAIQSAGLALGNILQQLIDNLMGALGSPGAGNDITAILPALLAPVTLVNNALAFLQTIAAQLGGIAGGHDARLNALEAVALGAKGLLSGDNFNRAAIGTNWTAVVGALVIQYGDFVRTSAFAAAYWGAGQPDSDRHGVTIKLVAKYPGDVRAFICSDTTMSNYVAVEIHAGVFGDDSIRLVTGSSPQFVVARKQANFPNYQLQDGDAISLRYDDVTNTYFVLRNTVVIDELTWTDTSNDITHGSTKRKVGVVTNALNQTPYPGFGITDFVYYDSV